MKRESQQRKPTLKDGLSSEMKDALQKMRSTAAHSTAAKATATAGAQSTALSKQPIKATANAADSNRSVLLSTASPTVSAERRPPPAAAPNLALQGQQKYKTHPLTHTHSQTLDEMTSREINAPPRQQKPTSYSLDDVLSSEKKAPPAGHQKKKTRTHTLEDMLSSEMKAMLEKMRTEAGEL